MSDPLAQNKENAIAFYQMAYSGQPRKAVEKYVGDEYIQHNPLVGDGKKAFIEYFDQMHREPHQRRPQLVIVRKP